jgi:hypothetical protein
MKPIGSLQPIASTEPVACKICQGPSPLFGVIDFHKSCIEAQGRRFAPSGYPVYYRRCSVCSFAFTTAFDTWTYADFHQQIYNEDYIKVDPNFVEVRPTTNAQVMADTFQGSRTSIHILDYGGGSGLTADLLRRQGFSATTYDPFSEFNEMPYGTLRPDLLLRGDGACALSEGDRGEDGIAADGRRERSCSRRWCSLLSSTAIGLNWWYAGPRNGHVSLYSELYRSSCCFSRHGMRVRSFSDGVHMAYRRIPAFASHLLKAA